MDHFKRAIRPEMEPSDWKFHAADLRSSRWRDDNSINYSIERVNAELRTLGDALAHESDDRIISVTICPVKKLHKLFIDSRNPKDRVRDLVISVAIYASTDELTKRGLTPSFVLESVSSKTDDNYMDFFAERIGRSLRHDLGYLYSCRCRHVGLPDTAAKGAEVELEFADLVAYTCNRMFLRRSIGRHPEIPVEIFGEARWGCFVPDRGFGMFPGVGFPWKTFFGK